MPTPWLLTVPLDAPTLANNTADAERLEAAVRAAAPALASAHDGAACRLRVARELLPELPSCLPRVSGTVHVLWFGRPDAPEIVAVAPGDRPAGWQGLAVDLGTTRIAVRVLDLETGAVVGEASVDNPQAARGADILARIHHAATPDGLRELSTLACAGIRQATRAALGADGGASHDAATHAIRLVTVAGNTAMTHLLLGLPPRHLIREPYVPVVNRPGVGHAAAVGLDVHPHARMYAFPNVGSYFGGDLVAGLLAAGIDTAEEPEILVDVGTNAEVALGTRDWIVACAGAAGPALEGGVARMGMSAGPGAIDRFWVDSDGRTLRYHTLGEGPPRGICGSGLIDLTACLLRTGRIDVRGRFVTARCGDALRERDGVRELVVVPGARAAEGQEIAISQADLDSLIRSKAAMFTILETLTAEVGLTVDDVARIRVAGTFGQFIDVESAITIGMLPDLPRERYVAIGNSALAGATRALVEPDFLSRAEALRDRITYVELNVNPAFMARFSAAKFLPHTEPERFPTVRLSGA